MTHFSLLNLSPAFDLDLTQLESAYFAAQRQYHPDRFTGKPEQEKLAAAQRSADINHAYKTLKEPLMRAQYLLKLQGVIVGTDHDTVKPSHALLTEVMEWREEGIEAAKLKEIQQQSIAKIAGHSKTAAWNLMAEETLRLGYIEKTLSEI
jgi:molecular chaperone HscB